MHSSEVMSLFRLTFSCAEVKSVSGYESPGIVTLATAREPDFKRLVGNGASLSPDCRRYLRGKLNETPYSLFTNVAFAGRCFLTTFLGFAGSAATGVASTGEETAGCEGGLI